MTKEIESPCIRVCQMDPVHGLCLGCARTLDEISRWARMTNAERARVMAELPRRRLNVAKISVPPLA
ncbi:MAG: DUF1289 domain-containing protein [Betaproteobacteria bacterium]|nr:DUF1289 domain-containing protein [Betaproteobacteria bacterium]MBV9361232.1 DUF1289 domain-containing protein [Betaproteobacteria bacterium]